MPETNLKFLPISQIKVGAIRQRTEFGEAAMVALVESLAEPNGQLQPIVVRALGEDRYGLIAGERRLRAMQRLTGNALLNLNQTPVNFNGQPMPKNTIAAIVTYSLADELALCKAEFAENAIREGLTFIEHAQALHRIAMLQAEADRQLRAEEAGVSPEVLRPTFKDLIKPAAVRATVAAVTANPAGVTPSEIQSTRTHLRAADIVNKDTTDPTMLKLQAELRKAPTAKEAQKIIQRADQAALNHKLGQETAMVAKKSHKILEGDCLGVLPTLQDGYYDVCLSDPTPGKSGDYETWQQLMPAILAALNGKLKKDAHLFLFCELEQFMELKTMVAASGYPDVPWKFHPVPLIQYQTEGGQLPVPGKSARRSYDCILFAWRGNAVVQNDLRDVIPCTADKTNQAPTNQDMGKPVSLLKTLLRWVAPPKVKVLDFLANGCGLLTAADECLCEATLIARNPAAYKQCTAQWNALQTGGIKHG